MRLEIIDNDREQHQLELGAPADKVHIVIEVEDITEARERISVDVLAITETSWGSRLFQIRDPDGVSITFLQWTRTEAAES
jgi:predicted enzyme related to lactoylglutathione lyase